MLDLSNINGFEWDKGNIDKSYKKHDIRPNESEEVFLDKDVLIYKDTRHSEKEERFTAIGKTAGENILLVVFTMRNDKIRIISARKSNKKERRLYEQKT